MQLPEIAKAIAAPLAKTEKMIFVSSDGGSASKLTADITTMMAQLGPAVQGLTGGQLEPVLVNKSLNHHGKCL
jgi:flotillin